MKIFTLFVLMTFIYRYHALGQDEYFYEKALKDFGRQSIFLAFELESPTYNGMVVIQNEALYHYFHKNEGMNQKTYHTYMKQILGKNAKIKIPQTNLEQWDFIMVKQRYYLKYTKSDKAQLLKTFFDDNNMIRRDIGIKDKVKFAIIYRLFQLQVLCITDDETGYLMFLD